MAKSTWWIPRWILFAKKCQIITILEMLKMKILFLFQCFITISLSLSLSRFFYLTRLHSLVVEFCLKTIFVFTHSVIIHIYIYTYTFSYFSLLPFLRSGTPNVVRVWSGTFMCMIVWNYHAFNFLWTPAWQKFKTVCWQLENVCTASIRHLN